jgi:hypothetical protein
MQLGVRWWWWLHIRDRHVLILLRGADAQEQHWHASVSPHNVRTVKSNAGTSVWGYMRVSGIGLNRAWHAVLLLACAVLGDNACLHTC